MEGYLGPEQTLFFILGEVSGSSPGLFLRLEGVLIGRFLAVAGLSSLTVASIGGFPPDVLEGALVS